MKNKLIYRVLPVCAALTAACALILLGCAANPHISNAFRQLSLLKGRIWGWLWGLVPTAASEIFIPLLGALVIWAIIYTVLRKKQWGLWLICLPFVLITMFVVLFGVHYTAPPLAEQIGLPVSRYTKEDLQSTLEQIIAEMNIYAPELDRNQSSVLSDAPFDYVTDEVALCYELLSGDSPALDSITRAPTPKTTAYSGELMSYFGIAGYFFPFTCTPVVSSNIVSTQIPYCIAHEWAHAGGIGPEDECNFVAFLACMQSDDIYIRYSALFNAYVYAGNALAAVDYDLAMSIISALAPECKVDINTLNTHIEKYETPVAEVGNAINDAYIKTTGQPDGVQSYGKMVDLLISYYKQQ